MSSAIISGDQVLVALSRAVIIRPMAFLVASSPRNFRLRRCRMPATSLIEVFSSEGADVSLNSPPTDEMTNSVPVLMCCDSLIALGITICPLLDTLRSSLVNNISNVLRFEPEPNGIAFMQTFELCTDIADNLLPVRFRDSRFSGHGHDLLCVK